jgi:hypothetical protein
VRSFDVASGAIDALFAVGIYSAIVVGVRAVIHRVRKTEPNPANNKWALLTIVLLAGAAFIGAGSLSSGADTASSCDKANKAMANLNSQLTNDPPQETKSWIALQASYVVTDAPQCFDPGLVASSQAYIARSK